MNDAREVHAAKERVMHDFRTIVTDAEDLLKATANQTGDKIAATRARLEATIKDARERVSELEENAMARGRAAVKRTDEYVHDNPWQAIGIAGTVGLLMGMLISRR